MTLELLGVTVEVEVATALRVAPEESVIFVNIAKDVGLLLKFVVELVIPSFDTVMTFEDKVVPSVEFRGVLFCQLLISVLTTFSLVVVATGAA